MAVFRVPGRTCRTDRVAGKEGEMIFEIDDFGDGAKIKVVGVGGGGGNAVNRMVGGGLTGVEFISVNTDLQALGASLAGGKIQIGKELTRGLGAGALPDIGRLAVEEDKEEVMRALEGADMVFVTAGMGGGTGTGAAPVIAEIARSSGALTVAIVTKPFLFEGHRRMMTAEEGINELRERADTVITIPNQRLLSIVPKDTSLKDAFKVADDVLLHATKGISDLIMLPGLINRDFADVRTVMKDKGNALMGIGVCRGEGRAAEAARAAISSPMLEDTNISGAQALLINVTGGESISLHEVSEAVSIVYDAAGDEANVLFGAVVDPSLDDEFKVTVIATGFGKNREKKRPIQEPTKEEELSRPAFLRRKTLEESFTLRKEKEFHPAANSLDIPSFIRRQL